MSSSVPSGLADAVPGPGLAGLLAAIDPSTLPDEDLLTVLNAQWRQLAHQQAHTWAVMAELANRTPANLPDAMAWTPDQVFEAAVDEVRAELRLTRRAAGREVGQADQVFAVPRVAAALRAGAIDRRRAIVLAEGCIDLTREQTARLLDDVLPDAGEVTATRLAERVQRLAIALDPAWAERRYREAVRQRKVVAYLNDDSTATVSGQHLPADQAAAACARVNALASAAKRCGAAAKIDHLRAELFLGLLDGRFEARGEAEIIAALVRQFPPADVPSEKAVPAAPLASKPGVEIRVGLATLLEVDDRPGEIAGWGPVPASVARDVVADQRRSQWRFAVVDADGRLLFDGITRHRPTTAASPGEANGGIVELQVPAAMLTDPYVAFEHPAWAKVIRDLAAQYAKQAPIEQDPAARFAGRPLRRRVQVRHRTCLFPGCRRPAADCDQDHRRDHAKGGLTTEANLGPGCRHDHGLKTGGGWRLVKRNDTTYVWISPLGRRHLATVDAVAPPLPPPLPRDQGPPADHVSDPDPPPPF